MLKTIVLCEGCEKEYHHAYRTDDDVLLCADCYIDLLKAELMYQHTMKRLIEGDNDEAE